MRTERVGVVLAAGRGSRLAPMTDRTPKPLIEVGGRPCLGWAIEALLPVVGRIVVVTGHLGDQVVAWVRRQTFPVPVETVRNPAPERGNLTSLLAAREAVGGGAFILANADHLFPADFYTGHFRPEEGVRIAAQRARPILEDEMKIRIGSGGDLLAISKGLTDFHGAYIGATCVSASAAGRYWEAFERVSLEADPSTACVEDVLAWLAAFGPRPRVVWCDAVRWHEVDTPEDLARAREALGP